MKTIPSKRSSLFSVFFLSVGTMVGLPGSSRQETPPTKPTEHVLGTVTAVDAAAHTLTVKDDKAAIDYLVSTANTRTMIKVLPAAKDLKGATRITADDLVVGDRVDVRGFKEESGAHAIAAKSLVLMSARELQQKHQADTAAWQTSTSGVVAAVDKSAGSITFTTKTPEGPKQVTMQVPATAEFTRYSPDSPKLPVRSQLSDIQPGDQVRVIGEKSSDGASISAERVYSGAFRTIAGTINSIAPDGKGLTLKNLQTKQPMTISLASDSAVRRLPPEMATSIARRLNPNGAAGARPQGTSDRSPTGSPSGTSSGTSGGTSNGTAPDSPRSSPLSSPSGAAGDSRGGPAGPGWHGPRNGDLAQLLQRLPEIPLSDLKPGDAVIISGALGSDKLQVVATNIIAGVEPILQSAPPRQGQSFDGWSLDMSAPAQ